MEPSINDWLELYSNELFFCPILSVTLSKQCCEMRQGNSQYPTCKQCLGWENPNLCYNPVSTEETKKTPQKHAFNSVLDIYTVSNKNIQSMIRNQVSYVL